MILIRALAFLLHFTVVPIAFGRLITYKVKALSFKTPAITYITGFFTSQAVFFIICSAVTWWQNYNTVNVVMTGAFSKLCYIYSAIAVAVVLCWLFLDIKSFKNWAKTGRDSFCQLMTEIKADKLSIIYMAVFALLFLVQLFFAYKCEVNEWSYDDYDYVVISQDDLSFDLISDVSVITGERPFTEPKRCATSWPAYLAYLARVSGFEVATVCHTIMPVLLLIVAYIVFGFMAFNLFERRDNRYIFLSLLSMVLIFGAFSHYSLTFRVLCTIWQGKAVLCGIAMPFLMIYLGKIMSKEVDKSIAPCLFAISLGTCSLTTMSMLLLGLEFLIMTAIMSVYNRKIYGVRYLLAGLLGPAFQLGFYQLVTMLLIEQQTWGKVWFGSNL